ncbi:dipeptidase [Variovorax sp. NFACC27]|uniref:dipeptidase n=1 Tax=unclassified Variovorax TaxID=663243 RepID=UPI0008970484|nr:dipeptidase, putative [Variovorax sp. NFACC28]SEG91616.1 dipeptidase, putative [Variovorax sp. NFACC29]SFD50819.1 dipeptidase, putative [Variovorax sp. NFACC26]SFG71881.1 dipeptidase, putative [Variovorax sp. NFACC27]
MPQFRFSLPALTMGLMAVGLTAPAFAETIKKPELDRLAASWQGGKTASSFNAFLAQAEKANPALKPAVAAYRKRAPLAGDDLTNIARLLGLYNRLHNQKAVIASLGAMVAIPTARNVQIPPHENPTIIEFGKLVEKTARNFGLEYRNVDNRIFEVSLKGKGSEEFGILTHSDVVPAVLSEWVLDDGTRLDPFTMVQVGDRLYGRGTIDDKGSIAAVLYAMKTVKESGLPIERTMRLMIETTEETGGDAMEYYRGKVPLPAYNIVLDSGYPAVVAEKGAGSLSVFFPAEKTDGGVTAITDMGAAAAVNAISQTATATLKGGDLAAAFAKLEAAKPGFLQKYEPQGGKFAIAVTRGTDSIDIKVTGTSAHGSEPQNGVNPLPRLGLFLLESGVTLADNQFLKAVKYVDALYGTGYLGEKIGLGYKDDFMGPLTFSPNLIRTGADGRLVVSVNTRMPRGRTPDELKAQVTAKINEWAGANKAAVEIKYDQGNWMARDPSGQWLTTLLNIYGDTTGLEAKPVSAAGATTAKQMPNAISFGPGMPGKKYTGHNAKEYKEVPDLDADLQMFTEMLVRIGNLKQMQ